jgi:hypothetical protein
MECPYCLKKIDPKGQKHFECTQCGSEIFLSNDNYLATAIRFKGTRKSTVVIWIAFIFLGAVIVIFGDGINSIYFPLLYFLFLGVLFANYFILAFKYKEFEFGPAHLSEATHPGSFSLMVGVAAILSIISFGLAVKEMINIGIF